MSSGGIGRASALLASGTLVSRALGFIKSIVLVIAIGQFTIAGNAFALATQLPNNIYALVAGGLLSAILVPQIVRARLHDDGGQAYINKIVTLGAMSFLVIAALATLAASLLVSLYARSGEGQAFTADGIALAVAFAMGLPLGAVFAAMAKHPTLLVYGAPLDPGETAWGLWWNLAHIAWGQVAGIAAATWVLAVAAATVYGFLVARRTPVDELHEAIKEGAV